MQPPAKKRRATVFQKSAIFNQLRYWPISPFEPTLENLPVLAHPFLAGKLKRVHQGICMSFHKSAISLTFCSIGPSFPNENVSVLAHRFLTEKLKTCSSN
jgi:hypothetical protein